MCENSLGNFKNKLYITFRWGTTTAGSRQGYNPFRTEMLILKITYIEKCQTEQAENRAKRYGSVK